MRWYATVDMSGALTDDQLMDIAGDKPASVEHHGDTLTTTMRITVDAAHYQTAVGDALAAFEAMDNTQRLIADGVVSKPYRFTVQTEDAEAQSLPILSTAGVAKRLGVSEARVRQLKNEIGFPQAFKIPGAAGGFYRTAEVDEYARTRKPGTPQQGKPRASDEELLNDGLRSLLDAPLTLDHTEAELIERARNTIGGRYVRGKAKVLVETASKYKGQLGRVDTSDRFEEALARAQEIWRP